MGALIQARRPRRAARDRWPAPRKRPRSTLVGVALVLGVSIAVARADDSKIDFVTQVQPILAQHCYECHGPHERKGDLRLTNRRDAFAPGDLGIPVIEPGARA